MNKLNLSKLTEPYVSVQVMRPLWILFPFVIPVLILSYIPIMFLAVMFYIIPFLIMCVFFLDQRMMKIQKKFTPFVILYGYLIFGSPIVLVFTMNFGFPPSRNNPIKEIRDYENDFEHVYSYTWRRSFAVDEYYVKIHYSKNIIDDLVMELKLTPTKSVPKEFIDLHIIWWEPNLSKKTMAYQTSGFKSYKNPLVGDSYFLLDLPEERVCYIWKRYFFS